jgi:long-chain acyl-CoA synthetase
MKVFRSKAGFGNLYLMMSGGAAINPETVIFFNGFGIICAQGYGLTETSPVICVNPPKKNKPSTVGPAIKGVEIRIAEPDNDQIGEIQAKGIPVFSGYYKNPEATREAFTDDGWFKTGDLGMMDSDGYVTITGRAKNVIVTGAGKNIYPEELEEKLNMSQFVVESLIVPTHSESGEEPFAIIVPDFDAVDAHFSGIWDDPALETLLKNEVEIINSKIAPYKRIKGFKIQQEEFPKTSTRKIKRYLFTGRGIIVKN